MSAFPRTPLALLLTLALATSAVAQSVSPTNIVMAKGQSAVVDVNAGGGCDVFMTTFLPDGALKILSIDPPATVATQGQQFTITGVKGGVTTLGFRLIGEDFVTGSGGPCQDIDEMFITVVVQDPVLTQKMYEGEAKAILKTMKTDAKAAISGLNNALKQITNDLGDGLVSGPAAMAAGVGKFLDAVAQLHNDMRMRLGEISAAGSGILTVQQYNVNSVPPGMFAGGGGAHDRIMGSVAKAYPKTWQSFAKAWDKFIQSLQKETQSQGNPLNVASCLVPPRLPQVAGPSTPDVTPTTPAPQAPDVILGASSAPDQAFYVGGLTDPAEDGSYEVVVDGPNGLDTSKTISPVAANGTWAEAFATPNTPGSYIAKLVRDGNTLPFQVMSMSLPSDP